MCVVIRRLEYGLCTIVLLGELREQGIMQGSVYTGINKSSIYDRSTQGHVNFLMFAHGNGYRWGDSIVLLWAIEWLMCGRPRPSIKFNRGTFDNHASTQASQSTVTSFWRPHFCCKERIIAIRIKIVFYCGTHDPSPPSRQKKHCSMAIRKRPSVPPS